MTDNPESASVADRAMANGNNSQQTDSPPSGSLDVDAIVKGVLAHPDFQKATQSVKDKRIAEIQTVVGEQSSEIARLAAALGHTPEEIKKAQTQIAIEDMVAQYQSGSRPSSQVPRQPSPASGVDLANARTSILEQTGLPANAPGFDDYLASLDWNDPVRATLSATAWAQNAKANIKQPSDSTMPPAPSNVPASSLSNIEKEELGTKLIELQRSPAKNRAEIEKIIAELERRDT